MAKPQAPYRLAKSSVPRAPSSGLCHSASLVFFLPFIFKEMYMFFQDPNLLKFCSILFKTPAKLTAAPFSVLTQSFVHASLASVTYILTMLSPALSPIPGTVHAHQILVGWMDE